ncbi:MAG: hypothetical protein J1D88_08400, partial [Treponema sp.]|nr:hypothetical protein [Treponema sp.]
GGFRNKEKLTYKVIKNIITHGTEHFEELGEYPKARNIFWACAGPCSMTRTPWHGGMKKTKRTSGNVIR